MSQNDSSGWRAADRGLIRFDLLDPRPRDVALKCPIRNGVCIPATEIADRPHELPPRSEPVRIANVEGYGAQACAALELIGRAGTLVSDWSFGSNTKRGRLWEPNEFLAGVSGELRPGHAVDLGCGSGRDCVALAAQGWSVRGIDHLEDAILRARSLANTYLDTAAIHRVRFEAVDVATANLSGQLDLVSFLFCFDRDWVRRAIEGLASGGSIVVEAFTPEHQRRQGRPSGESRVVKAGELEEMAANCRVRIVDEGLRPNGKHTARLWATKI